MRFDYINLNQLVPTKRLPLVASLQAGFASATGGGCLRPTERQRASGWCQRASWPPVAGCWLQQWQAALGGTVAASGREGLRLGAVGKAGRFGGLHLEKKTHLCKGLWIIYNFLKEKMKQKFVISLRALWVLKWSVHVLLRAGFREYPCYRLPWDIPRESPESLPLF